MNPCPKNSWHNLLRGQLIFYYSLSGTPTSWLAFKVSLLCLIGSRENRRCKFTTDLTHGRSRSPLLRYGRHYCRVTALGCKCNSIVVVYYLNSDSFTGLSGPPRLSCFKFPVETIAAPNEVNLIMIIHHSERFVKNFSSQNTNRTDIGL